MSQVGARLSRWAACPLGMDSLWERLFLHLRAPTHTPGVIKGLCPRKRQSQSWGRGEDRGQSKPLGKASPHPTPAWVQAGP